MMLPKSTATAFSVRASADRRGLELDDAAQADLDAAAFVGAGSLEIGPCLESPIAGRHLGEWLFEQVRWGDRAGFWLLRCRGSGWLRVRVHGSSVIVEPLAAADDTLSGAFGHIDSTSTAPAEACNLASGIDAVLGRTAWAGRISVAGLLPRRVDVGYCAFVAHLLLDWASFDLAAGRDFSVQVGLSEGAEALQFAGPGIARWVNDVIGRSSAGGSGWNADLLPVALFRAQGIGGGIWRVAGAGGASVGLATVTSRSAGKHAAQNRASRPARRAGSEARQSRLV